MGINGTYEVNYEKKQIIIYVSDSKAGTQPEMYYGIFNIGESGPRSTLTFEYQEGSYPTSFDSKAQHYVIRDNGLEKFKEQHADANSYAVPFVIVSVIVVAALTFYVIAAVRRERKRRSPDVAQPAR